MHRLFLLAFFLPLVCVLGCAHSQQPQPHAQWSLQYGGLDHPSSPVNFLRAARCAAALARLQSNLTLNPTCCLSTNILRSPACLAFSFPDGQIFLSAGLIDKLTDDELAAVVAHELGHLLHNNVIHSPAALQENAENENIELAADALGRELLASHHIPTTALTSALIKVADSTPIYPSLHSRILHLHTLDQSSAN